MGENNQEEAQQIQDENIFEWFASDEELLQDVDSFEKNEKKDIYDHANITWNILKICNIVLIFVLAIAAAYIYIQKNENLSSSAILDPFCSAILWDIPKQGGYCSSVTSVLNQLETKVANIKTEQFNAIAGIIQPLYLATDFINSSEVLFLLDSANLRLKPMAILEEFDTLKNEFEWLDKSALNCYNIEIKDNIMSAKCDVYSSDWDREITLPTGESWWKIGGTSISIASSFVDFIEKNSRHLRVNDKPKHFSAENVSWENGGYTKKTTFFLQLEYSNDNLPFN